MATSEILWDILVTRRQYFIEKVKAPMMNSMIGITNVGKGFTGTILLLWDVYLIVRSINRYPEPTRENTKKKITLVLFDIWDEFEKYNLARIPLYRAVRKMTICICESDTSYSQRLTWFIKKLVEKYLNGEWLPLLPYCPSECWTEEAIQEALVKERAKFKKMITLGVMPAGVES